MTSPDAVLPVLVALLAGMAAAQVVQAVGQIFFYQTYTPGIVSAACGLGHVIFDNPPQALTDFLLLKAQSLDCATLADAGAAHIAPPSPWPWLSGSVELLWRFAGLAYRVLWPLIAALHIGFALGAYALARCFFRPAPAALAGGLIAVSPVALSFLPQLRDYSKAPFIIWGVVFCIWMMRARSPRTMLAFAAVGGVLTAAGVGFRTDVLLLAPVFLLAGLCAARFAWRVRVGAIAAYLAATYIALLPLPSQGASGGVALIALQGMTTPFSSLLAIDPTFYDIGWAYSDELALGTIAADLRKNPLPFNRKPPVPGVADAFANANAHATSWMPIFAADLATRALKAAYLTSSFFPLLAPEWRELDPHRGPLLPLKQTIAVSTWPAWLALARIWLLPLGALGFGALVARIYARSGAEALFVAVGLCALFGFEALQFSLRHFFHYEAFAWLFVIALFALPFDRMAWRWMPRFLCWVLGGAVLVAVSWIALGGIQQKVLEGAVAQLLSAPRVAIRLKPETRDGAVFFPLAVPETLQPIVDSPPDSHAASNKWTGVLSRLDTGAVRLIMTLDPARCAADTLDVSTVYSVEPETWQSLKRTMSLPLRTVGDKATLIIPAFYRPTQHLLGLSVSPQASGCVAAIDSSVPAGSLPSSFGAYLPADWRDDMTFRQDLGRLW